MVIWQRTYGKEHKDIERKKGNVSFNDTLNTFYLWLYGRGHMVKNMRILREETHCCNFMGSSD